MKTLICNLGSKINNFIAKTYINQWEIYSSNSIKWLQTLETGYPILNIVNNIDKNYFWIICENEIFSYSIFINKDENIEFILTGTFYYDLNNKLSSIVSLSNNILSIFLEKKIKLFQIVEENVNNLSSRPISINQYLTLDVNFEVKKSYVISNYLLLIINQNGVDIFKLVNFSSEDQKLEELDFNKFTEINAKEIFLLKQNNFIVQYENFLEFYKIKENNDSIKYNEIMMDDLTIDNLYLKENKIFILSKKNLRIYYINDILFNNKYNLNYYIENFSFKNFNNKLNTINIDKIKKNFYKFYCYDENNIIQTIKLNDDKNNNNFWCDIHLENNLIQFDLIYQDSFNKKIYYINSKKQLWFIKNNDYSFKLNNNNNYYYFLKSLKNILNMSFEKFFIFDEKFIILVEKSWIKIYKLEDLSIIYDKNFDCNKIFFYKNKLILIYEAENKFEIINLIINNDSVNLNSESMNNFEGNFIDFEDEYLVFNSDFLSFFCIKNNKLIKTQLKWNNYFTSKILVKNKLYFEKIDNIIKCYKLEDNKFVEYSYFDISEFLKNKNKNINNIDYKLKILDYYKNFFIILVNNVCLFFEIKFKFETLKNEFEFLDSSKFIYYINPNIFNFDSIKIISNEYNYFLKVNKNYVQLLNIHNLNFKINEINYFLNYNENELLINECLLYKILIEINEFDIYEYCLLLLYKRLKNKEYFFGLLIQDLLNFKEIVINKNKKLEVFIKKFNLNNYNEVIEKVNELQFWLQENFKQIDIDKYIEIYKKYYQNLRSLDEFSIPYFNNKDNLNTLFILSANFSMQKDFILKNINNEPTFSWEKMKKYGVILWYDNINVWKAIITKSLILEYKVHKDVFKLFIWFILFDNKKILIPLLKLDKKQEHIYKFLMNNFNETKWKEYSYKNAFVLCQKKNFSLAISFFLLGDKYFDAIEIALFHLKDLQLAIFLLKYLKIKINKEEYEKFINEKIINNNNLNIEPYLLCIFYYLIDDYLTIYNIISNNKFDNKEITIDYWDKNIKTSIYFPFQYSFIKNFSNNIKIKNLIKLEDREYNLNKCIENNSIYYKIIEKEELIIYYYIKDFNNIQNFIISYSIKIFNSLLNLNKEDSITEFLGELKDNFNIETSQFIEVLNYKYRNDIIYLIKLNLFFYLDSNIDYIVKNILLNLNNIIYNINKELYMLNYDYSVIYIQNYLLLINKICLILNEKKFSTKLIENHIYYIISMILLKFNMFEEFISLYNINKIAYDYEQIKIYIKNIIKSKSKLYIKDSRNFDKNKNETFSILMNINKFGNRIKRWSSFHYNENNFKISNVISRFIFYISVYYNFKVSENQEEELILNKLQSFNNIIEDHVKTNILHLFNILNYQSNDFIVTIIEDLNKILVASPNNNCITKILSINGYLNILDNKINIINSLKYIKIKIENYLILKNIKQNDLQLLNFKKTIFKHGIELFKFKKDNHNLFSNKLIKKLIFVNNNNKIPWIFILIDNKIRKINIIECLFNKIRDKNGHELINYDNIISINNKNDEVSFFNIYKNSLSNKCIILNKIYNIFKVIFWDNELNFQKYFYNNIIEIILNKKNQEFIDYNEVKCIISHPHYPIIICLSKKNISLIWAKTMTTVFVHNINNEKIKLIKISNHGKFLGYLDKNNFHLLEFTNDFKLKILTEFSIKNKKIESFTFTCENDGIYFIKENGKLYKYFFYKIKKKFVKIFKDNLSFDEIVCLNKINRILLINKKENNLYIINSINNNLVDKKNFDYINSFISTYVVSNENILILGFKNGLVIGFHISNLSQTFEIFMESNQIKIIELVIKHNLLYAILSNGSIKILNVI